MNQKKKWGQKRMSIFQIPETVCHWMQNAVSESEWQEVHRNDIPAPWVTPVITCSLRCHKPVNVFVSASNQTTSVSHWSLMPHSNLVLSDRLHRGAGGRVRGCDGRSAARVRQAWLPSDAAEAEAEPGLCHEQKSRLGSGCWAGGVGYINASWQRGLFPSNTQVHIQCSHTGAVVSLLLPLIPLQHMQTSLWSCWEAVSDEFRRNGATSLLCYKSLHAGIPWTAKSALMSSTIEMSE